MVALQTTANTTLTNIYDRLEHVKVDSFVNVRVVDELGELPLPATTLTGLLVSFVADTPPLQVHVTNEPLVTTVTNTTPIPVGIYTQTNVEGTVAWKPTVGVPATRLNYYRGDTIVNDIFADHALLAIGAGGTWNVGGTDKNVAVPTMAPLATYYQFKVDVNPT